jgi:uncharacterized SAM-binding protein YcdF (DUF218 family)
MNPMAATVARFFLDPFNIFLMLLAACVFFRYYGRTKLFRWGLAVTGGWFLLITTPFVPYLILNSLENLYDPLDTKILECEECEYHIVVLGAGYIYNERLPANSQLNHNSRGRIVEGVRLFYELPHSRLVASGPYNNRYVSQAEVVMNTAVLLGVPEDAILIQSEPGTTFEEAKIYYEKYYGGQNVILVTSAAHMHRALSEFHNLGIPAIPSPTNFTYRSAKGFKMSFIPSPEHISDMKTGVFEYAALFRNRLRDL